MPRPLGGTPSDQLPAVLAAGRTDVGLIFVSFSAREPHGRDDEYLEWHSLDHRAEQHRLPGLRQSLRIVSTPPCRDQRAASTRPFDAVDHVMTYFFTDVHALAPFQELSDALTSERRPLALPSIEHGVYELAGKEAAPRAVVGADVLPWRPALGIYLLLEEGSEPPSALVGTDGVAGAWWGADTAIESPFVLDRRGRQITYLFLEEDPVLVARRLRSQLAQRWEGGRATPLLAAPFHVVVPYEWSRYLP